MSCKMCLKQCCILLRHLLKPGYAQFGVFPFTLSIIAVSFVSDWFSQYVSIGKQVLGGLASWVGGALIMLVVYKYFSRFARESAKAKRMLSAKELPCLKCGYPLMTAEYLVCSECGEHCQRSKTIEIWRSRYLVDPFPFEEVSDK